VESGKLAASDHFYSRDEWFERLTALVDRYNDEGQDGKYLAGLSPREAYEKHFDLEPLARLPDSARYLLANERKRLKVGRNGISFRVGREAFTYKSRETGALIGSSVEVFFNRESPEVLGVKHPESGDVFAVRRATLVPAMDADEETLAQAFGENAAHDSYKRALYRAVAPQFSQHFLSRPIFRLPLVDGATATAGRQLAESAGAKREEATTENRLRRRTVAAAGRAGMVVRGETDEERAESLEKLSDRLNADGAQLEEKKTYVLKETGPLTPQEFARYFGAWRRAEKAEPGLNRHALTQQILGHNKPHKELTRGEWRKMVSAFEQIAKAAETPV
jgi:hypothetical protein